VPTINWRPDRPARKNQKQTASLARRPSRPLASRESQSQRVFATVTDCARNAGRQRSLSNTLGSKPLRPLHRWIPARALTRPSRRKAGVTATGGNVCVTPERAREPLTETSYSARLLKKAVARRGWRIACAGGISLQP